MINKNISKAKALVAMGMIIGTSIPAIANNITWEKEFMDTYGGLDYILGGQSLVQVATAKNVKELNAIKATPKNIINGKIDSIWNDASEISNLHLVSGKVSEANSKMSAKALWDNQNLYILLEVEDEDIFINDVQKYNGDCVDLYIDGGNEKNTDNYDGNDLSLKIMPDGTLEKAVQGVELSSKNLTGQGYVVQVKIPWNVIKVNPSQNKVIGFDVQLNEGNKKASKREVFSVWNGDENLWKNLSSTGNLRLGGELSTSEPEYQEFTNWFKDPGFNNSGITNSQIIWDSSSWNKHTFQSYLVKEGNNNAMEIKSTTSEGNLKLVMNGLKPNTKYTLSFDAKTTMPGKASVGVSKYGSYDIFKDLTKTWQNYTIDFTTGQNMDSAIFLVWNKTGGVNTRIDNLKLSPYNNTDKTAPKINYSGNTQIDIIEGSKFSMPSVTAWDDKDGNITPVLTITKDGETVSNVDTNKLGTYKLTYIAKDKSNNQSVPLIINVEVNANPTSNLVNWFKDPSFNNASITNSQLIWGSTWHKETFTTSITKFPGTNDNVMLITNNKATTSKNQGNMHFTINGLEANTNYTIKFKAHTNGKANIGVEEEWLHNDLTKNTWNTYQIAFRTGANETQVNFRIWNKEANVKTYIDELELMVKPHESGENLTPETTEGIAGQLNPAAERLYKDTPYAPMSDPQNQRNWRLSETFSDEFSGAKLSQRWTSENAWKGRFPSYFVPSNVNVRDGKMILTSKWGNMVKDNDGFVVDKGQMTQGFEAAIATSTQKTGYGYYEVRTRTAPISMTNSFWFFGKTKEVDVYEQLGRAKINHKSDAFPINTHDFANGWENDVPTPYVYHTGVDLTLDYHVYGFEWGKEWLKFYFDGELIHTIKNTKFHEPMNVKFDTETFKWNGYPNKEDFKMYKDPLTGEDRSTGDFYIDYFRVWRTDTNQVEEDAPEVEIGKAKEAKAVYGTPKDIGANGVDSIWNKAETLKEFKLLSGGIEKMNAKINAKAMWDNNNLYVLAEVEDKDVFINYSEKHNGDCVDIYLDGGNEKQSGSYDANDLALKLMPDGTLLNKPAGVEISSKIEKGQGYIVQVKIPWSLLKTNAWTNKTIGFDVQLNEGHSNTGKREGFTTWNGNKELWKTMESSGNLKLIK